MDYYEKNGDIILRQTELDLDETLDCGQAFRWEAVPSEHYRTYQGYYKSTPLTVSQKEKDEGVFIFHNVSEQQFTEIWADYFDLSCDYSELKRRFSEDETLSRACGFAGGIRLLRQDSEECLISFILSQNNNIPRIKGIIGRLCEMYGKFPSAEDMKGVTAESLAPLRAGFRAKYIEDCINKLCSGEVDIKEIKKLPAEDARRKLMAIKGVGPKVADCTMLFGMYKTDCVPMDVWMKRVMEVYYPNGLPAYITEYAGIAQQYLFHYIRHNHSDLSQL